MNDKTVTAPLHDNLRDLIGQAISDEIAGGAEQPDWCDSREIDRLADAVLDVLLGAKSSALIAASGGPFMYAIMAPDGTAHIDENCVSDNPDSTALHMEVNCLNDSPDTGYTIVPVYLAAPQQHAQAAQESERPKCIGSSVLGEVRGVRCATCKGTGIVDDGEIDCYPNGDPYMNGPVKCVKDCPDCFDSRVTGNAQAALSDFDTALILRGLKVADVLIDMIPTLLHEHSDESIALIGKLVNVSGGYDAIASAKRCFSQFADNYKPAPSAAPVAAAVQGDAVPEQSVMHGDLAEQAAFREWFFKDEQGNTYIKSAWSAWQARAALAQRAASKDSERDAALLEKAAQTCDQQADGTNGPYRSACLQCADAVRAPRDAAIVGQDVAKGGAE